MGAASEETRRAFLRLGPVECYWLSGQPLCYRQWSLAMPYLPLFLFPQKKRKISHSIGFSGSVCPRSSKASGREDVVAWGRARCAHEPVAPPPRRNRACGFHRTRLPSDWRLPLPALPLGLSDSSRSLPPQPSDGTMDCPDLHRGQSSYWTSPTSIPWRPSPCTRLSRAPSTMTPPTRRRFIRGLHPAPHEPPTFTMVYSTGAFRRRLISDPSRSSRYPDRAAGLSG